MMQAQLQEAAGLLASMRPRIGMTLDHWLAASGLSSWSAGSTCHCRNFSSVSTNPALTFKSMRAFSSQPSKAKPALQTSQAPTPSQTPTLPPDITATRRPGPLKPRMVPLQHRKQSYKASYIPWVYSRHLTPQRHVANRMGFLMETLEREQEAAARATRPRIDNFEAGDILEVCMRVPEAEGAVYSFKGVCLARYNKGIRTAFKIYNIYAESGGVVQHLPLYMPDLLSVKVVGQVPARRSKLYYLLRQEGGQSYQAEPLMLAGPGGAAIEPTTTSKAKGSKGKGAKAGGKKAAK